MATSNLYLDCRAVGKGQLAPLKISINKQGRTALIPLDVHILPSQWDKRAKKIIDHPNKRNLNAYIAKRKVEVETILLSMYSDDTCARMTAQQIKEYVCAKLKLNGAVEQSDLFYERFLQFANSKSESTKRIYLYTYGRLEAFAGAKLKTLRFEDISREWLTEFENFLAKTATKNSRNISLRNIRAVFNEAIDNGVTSFYPFRRFPITPVATAKRSLSILQLATLFNANCELPEYLDIFKLVFYLIGINVIDLYGLTGITSEGRIEYHRAKTKRFYSIRVEPEALEIINRYRGEKRLLNISERCSNHRNYIHRINEALQHIGPYTKHGRGGKRHYQPLFPNLTTYWARHTWATIAAELDIPKETIAAALGHSMGNPTTAIYIDFNLAKVDQANRQVIDCVNCARLVLCLIDKINWWHQYLFQCHQQLTLNNLANFDNRPND